MRELEAGAGVGTCLFCGAPAAHSGRADGTHEYGLCVPWGISAAGVSTARERSVLAYAAGYAGLAYLFGSSFTRLIFVVLGMRGAAGAALVSLWSLLGPVALGLAYAAGASLDRSPEKSGRLPALVGLLAGLFGSFHVAAELLRLVRFFDIF
jgi:hypothetical protein